MLSAFVSLLLAQSAEVDYQRAVVPSFEKIPLTFYHLGFTGGAYKSTITEVSA